METRVVGGIDGEAPQAVRTGDLIFVGGLMAVDDGGNIVGDDVATQAHSIFDRLRAVLAEAGASLADVVKHNVYFTCENNQAAAARFLDELDAVRTNYFAAPGPTTTEIRCGLDRQGALLMVDASAVVGGQRSLDRDGNVLGVGDIEIQTDEAFRNLDSMLRAGGGDRNSLMRQNTYFRFFGEGREVTDYWEKMTNVRRRYMSVPSAAGAGLRIEGMGDIEELIQVEGIGMLGQDKQRLQPENHWDWSIPNTQFTQGWKIGRLGFIGGQISADNKARAVGDDMETQTRNVFNFVRSTLAEGGLDESHVAKLYIYYHAEGGWAEIEATRAVIAKVQREFYPEPGPAVTAVRVAGFAFEELLIEIEAMAVTPD
ncbi:Rid family hydrolase [Mesorhizobium yinganensis]|uniref:Rid family hydrolase n=1 Tax=Mesorhizobium yinganensis TaxID=3157707 RepID=UPI0032B87EF9